MNEFNKSLIYYITSKDLKKIYIGSTVQTLEQRINRHKTDYTGWLRGNRDYRSSFEILKTAGYDYNVIKYLCCNSKKELLQIEGNYIKLFRIYKVFDVVNKILPSGRFINGVRRIYTEEERVFYNRNKKQYRIDNVERDTKYRKQYNIDNKDKKQKYYDDTREKEQAQKKVYREHRNSWGGDHRHNNNLLQIDINLFI